MASNNILPEEIYSEILLRLPVKSTLVCKCVCKTWFSLISNPSFAKSHLNRTIQTKKPTLILNSGENSSSISNNRYREVIYTISQDSLQSLVSIDDEDFVDYAVDTDYPFKSLDYRIELQGCCDGLVCLCLCCRDSVKDLGKNFVCLWNPATKEYKKLPRNENHSHDFSMIGLCFDSKSDDYKLVTLGFRGVIQVYSLGSNSWTSMNDNVPYKFRHFREVGVLVNGDLHWVAEGAQDSSQVLVCLDIGDCMFREIQLPYEAEALVKKNGQRMSVGVLDGCLCLIVSVRHLQSQVWVMQDYGVQESWSKRYVIKHDDDDFLTPIWSFKSGGELLFTYVPSDYLGIYDPKTQSSRKPHMPSFTEFYVYQEGWYYESLVSLRSGTYVGGEDEEARRGRA